MIFFLAHTFLLTSKTCFLFRTSQDASNVPAVEPSEATIVAEVPWGHGGGGKKNRKVGGSWRIIPTSEKLGTYRGYNSSCLSIRPFIGAPIIPLFITSAWRMGSHLLRG